MDLSAIRIPLILALLAGGSVISVAGLWLVFRPRVGETWVGQGGRMAWPSVGRSHWVILAGIMAAALALRLEGIERRGMTHVEVYVPGIELPDGLSEPPARKSLRETVSFHIHDEPHPPGYYFFMWGWTRAFGTSLTSIRLPSVLLGTLAVALVFLLGARLFDPWSGLVAAGMLALNGHQVYWSQYARMYIPSTVLAIGSTLLLVGLLRASARRPLREMAYVAVTWLMLFTQLLSWALLGAQVLVALRYARSMGRLPRVLQLQGLTVILGTPMLAHAVYRSRVTEFLDVSVLAALQDFLMFGFLFEPDTYSIPERGVPLGLVMGITGLALACLALATRSRSPFRVSPTATAPGPWAPLAITAFGVALFLLGFSLVAWRRQGSVAATALVPPAVLALMWIADRSGSFHQRLQSWMETRARIAEAYGMVLILSLGPLLLLALVHLAKPVLTSRGAMVATPFLLLALAEGIRQSRAWRVPAIVTGVAVLALHAASFWHYREIPTPNDYRGLAVQMNEAVQPGDLVFVRPRDWATTPLFYHLQVPREALVGWDEVDLLANRADARIWVPMFSDMELSDSARMALGSRRLSGELHARRARAQLYAP